MSWIAAGVAVAGLAVSLSGNRSAKKAAKKRGEAIRRAKEYEALQYEQQAGQVVAAAQRVAGQERQKAKVIASRALALAAASGAGASDTTVDNILADIDGEGAYRASVALYQGEEHARRLKMAAYGRRLEGEAAKDGADVESRAYDTEAAGSIIGAASSLYGKYSSGGPSQTQKQKSKTTDTSAVTSEYDYTGYA